MTLNENKSILAKLYQPRLPQNSMAYNEDAVKLTLPVSERDHIQGPNTAPVTLKQSTCEDCWNRFVLNPEVQVRIGLLLNNRFYNTHTMTENLELCSACGKGYFRPTAESNNRR